jgi:hypothetical protein
MPKKYKFPGGRIKGASEMHLSHRARAEYQAARVLQMVSRTHLAQPPPPPAPPIQTIQNTIGQPPTIIHGSTVPRIDTGTLMMGNIIQPDLPPIPPLQETGELQIPRIIHQIYGMFGDGKPIEEIPVFHKNTQLTKGFCEARGIEYRMWDLDMATALVKEMGPKYEKVFWSERFREQPILRADLIRYIILYKFGGIYVDADIHPIRSLERLFAMPYFFVTWADDKKKRPYNAVMGTFKDNPIFQSILDHSIESFHEKLKTIPISWKGRFVFQVTGHSMLKRVLKGLPGGGNILTDVLYQPPNKEKGRGAIGDPRVALFEDDNASLWYSGSSKVAKMKGPGSQMGKDIVGAIKRQSPGLKYKLGSQVPSQLFNEDDWL